MKNTKQILMAALAGITFLALSAPLQAQYKPTGTDGITASPRVRAQLDERHFKANPPVAAAPSMACPRCQEQYVRVPDNDSKGLGARTLLAGGAPTRLIASHLCAGCTTTIGVSGTGKAKQTVASHTCTACGVQNLACCNTSMSGTVATKGMEQ